MATINSTATKHCNLITDIEIAKKTGFDSMEIHAEKIYRYIDAGYTIENLKNALNGIKVVGVGFLKDIERQNDDFHSLIEEAHHIFNTAKLIGSPGVQILTGPIDVKAVQDFVNANTSKLYQGLLGMKWSEQRRLTAKNVSNLADIAKEYGVVLYIEALAWAPINTIAKTLEVIDAAERDNVKIVIDYWHCFVAGDKPEDIAKMNKKYINCVHICDSLSYNGGIPDESILRDVATGSGVIPLKEWTDAIKATGFDGWWSCELFYKKQQEDNPYDSAKLLRKMLSELEIN